jgi:hypothetical protein
VELFDQLPDAALLLLQIIFDLLTVAALPCVDYHSESVKQQWLAGSEQQLHQATSFLHTLQYQVQNRLQLFFLIQLVPGSTCLLQLLTVTEGKLGGVMAESMRPTDNASRQ